jgi:hypothetical protein
MKNLIVMGTRVNDWLYYETGFEQLHPHLEIIKWMESHGWEYQKDWFCEKVNTKLSSYVLKFPSEESVTMFLLRWA